MAATASQTVAGHPIAMKVGGRRMSLSKSPSAQKSFLASSPPKQTEVPKPTEEATVNPTSPNHKEDGYPRPEGGHHDAPKEGEKDEKKKEEQQNNKKKEKKEFEHVKQQNINKNPPAQNNYSIKQPAGKTMM